MSTLQEVSIEIKQIIVNRANNGKWSTKVDTPHLYAIDLIIDAPNKILS